MRSLVCLMTMAAAVAACHDVAGGVGGPAAPRVASVPLLASAEPATQFWAQMPPAEKAAAVRAIERIAAEQGAMYLRGEVVLIDGDLPGGAQALVIRETTSPERPLLVFSAKHFSDEVFATGVAAFSQDSMDRSVSQRRVLRVLAQGQVVTGAGEVRPAVRGFAYGRPPTHSLTDHVMRTATSMTPVDLAGIGHGKRLRFNP